MMVSVIVPNYNHAPYLSQRIDSILQQTFQDFELLLLDDCSSDNSKEILYSYKDHPKVSHILLNEVNSGSTFKQWERGISAARGEYIWIAESDDWCEPSFLEVLVEGMDKDSNCSFAYCQTISFLNNGMIVDQSNTNRITQNKLGNQFFKENLLQRNSVWNASMVLFRKEAAIKVSDFYKEFKFCGDWVFWTEMSCLTEESTVFISGRKLNYFRHHDKDVSGKAYKTGLNFLEEIKAIKYFESVALITRSEFNDSILAKYLHFKEASVGLSKTVVNAIEVSFKEHVAHADYRKIVAKSSTHRFKRKVKDFLRIIYGK